MSNLRREYKRPFYRTGTFIFLFFILLFAICEIIIYRDSLKFWRWDYAEWIAAFIVGLPVCAVVILPIFLNWYYVSVNIETIQFTNYLLPCVKIEYNFSDISEFSIIPNRGGWSHIHFYKKSGKRTFPLGLDGLGPSDYNNLKEILRDRGLTEK